MLKKLSVTILFSGTILFTGCAVRPTHAIIYSNTVAPYMATSAKSGSKVGESDTCTNILGIIATGDCSISTAARKGNIKKITTVDWQGTNFLGIYASGKTIVSGD